VERGFVGTLFLSNTLSACFYFRIVLGFRLYLLDKALMVSVDCFISCLILTFVLALAWHSHQSTSFNSLYVTPLERGTKQLVS